MHIFSSDWYRHDHDCDVAYDTVILHVVYEYDKPTETSEGHTIPCIELKDRINPSLKSRYADIINQQTEVPCASQLTRVSDLVVDLWKTRLAAERLEEKAKKAKSILISSQGDWNHVMYSMLSRYMGSRVNTDAFEALAQRLPYPTIMKNSDSRLKVEALLYGVAGFLQASHNDAYYGELKAEYKHLSVKYALTPLPPVSWKFMRMRPANFPTIRISQLSDILMRHKDLFSKLSTLSHINDLRDVLQGKAHAYWDIHYTFGKDSTTQKAKVISRSFADLLIINVVAPILHLYALETDDPCCTEKALDILQQIKAENNRIIKTWTEVGLPVKTALDSQSLIHLRANYCDQKRCLSCAIGNSILS